MSTMARNNIRYYRKQRGLSQKELAEKAKVCYVTITNLERSGSQPSVRVRKSIAEVLDVDEDSLCGFDSPFVPCTLAFPKDDGDYLCAYKVHPRSPYEYQVLHWSIALKAWSTNFSSAPVSQNAVKFWMEIPQLPYIL